MTSFNNFGVPLGDKRGAILKPQTQYQFRVLPLNVGTENSELFASLTQTCVIKLNEQIAIVEVLQGQKSESWSAVQAVVDRCSTMVVDFLDGGQFSNFGLALEVESIKHECSLNYGNNKSLTHKLTISFGSCKVINGDKPEAESTLPFTMVETNPNEFLTPEAAMDLVNSKVEANKAKSVKTKNAKSQADKD